LFSALFGTLSHLFLDGMYHLDMKMPQSQWAIAKVTYGTLSGTEGICLMAAASGLLIFSVAVLVRSLPFNKNEVALNAESKSETTLQMTK
jgi:hypothetical protein